MAQEPSHKNEIVLVTIPRKVVVPDDLREAAAQGRGTEYFQGFHFGSMVNYGHPLTAYNEVIRVLRECRTADDAAFRTIHKGGTYYWLGMAAFLARDYETAVFFMDAAASEDLRSDQPKLDTPALLFIQLLGAHPAQAA